ncbi:hypothetical protein [Cardiobacterium hominis]|uniref:hypothetical protein n=1 Tax=Cardiobacterium hominis TaxID=2718 RepID=UPI00065FCCD4|nr:hypothetical protein [Cardiobacterium hominis]
MMPECVSYSPLFRQGDFFAWNHATWIGIWRIFINSLGAVCISLGMLSLRGFTFLSSPDSLEKVFAFFKGIPFLPASQGRKIQIANML